MNTFEIEIKILLWSQEKAQELVQKLYQNDTSTVVIWENSQLNHYFLPEWNFDKLYQILQNYIATEHHAKLHQVIVDWKNHSIRTREVDGKVLFIVKASVDDTTSSNWTARIEFEEQVNLPLDQIEQILVDNWFPYQSKWSRQRKEYKYKDYNVCIDKNAWYWYVAEFEKIIANKDQAESTKEEIRKELNTLWIEELDQNRLERMFAFYNKNRPEYYGTEKTFIIE